MTFRFLLALVGLFLIAPAVAGDRDGADALHYEIDVIIRPDGLDETVTIRFAADGLPNPCRLELASAMTVEAARSGDRDVPFERQDFGVSLDLRKAPRRDGAVEVTLTAAGTPFNRQSGRRLRTTVGADIAYIRGQYPWYPRVAGDFATMRTRVTAREDWQVRTAGIGSSGEPMDGRRTWTFVQEVPIRSTGLVAGPYVRIQDGAIDALAFAGNEEAARHLLGVGRRALDHYSRRFGPLRSGRFTVVEMPEAFGAGGGYGDAGYVLLGSGAFRAAGDAPWADSLVAHEAAHLWFGQEVGFGHFVHEALACYCAHGFTEEDLSPAVARQERVKAIASVARADADGKSIALPDIRSYGSGLPPGAYRANAYDKGMMLFVMLEDALGRKKLDGLLARFVKDHRGSLVDYPKLRAALVKGGEACAAILDRWERPGLPRIELSNVKETKGKVRGVLEQSGGEKPYPLAVEVVAVCDDEVVTKTVKLTKASAAFTLKVPGPTLGLVVDPDHRILAARAAPVGEDVGAAIDDAFRVVNSPKERNARKLEEAIAILRRSIRLGAGQDEGRCHTGIGRCLFRMGKHQEAAARLRAGLALGPGGPFHVRWIRLRLGCMADLAGNRAAAKAEYERVIAQGKDDLQTRMARRFLERPYRGIAKDG